MDHIKSITAFPRLVDSNLPHYDEEMMPTKQAENMKNKEIKRLMSTTKPPPKIPTPNSHKGHGTKVLYERAENNAPDENNTSSEMPEQFPPTIVQECNTRSMVHCSNG